MTDSKQKTQSNQESSKLKYLMQSTLLEEASTPRWLLSSVALIFILFIGIVIWAYYTQIDEVSKAQGIIQPLTETEIIEHHEGGIVTHLYVTNGQEVSSNTPLITIHPNFAQSELLELQTQEIKLLLEQIRLRAFIEQQPITRDEIIEKISSHHLNDNHDIATLIDSTLELLSEQNKAVAQQLNALEAKTSEQQLIIKNLNQSIQNRKNRLQILAKSKEIYEELDKTQDISKVSLMDAIERYNEAEGEILEMLAEEQKAKNTLQELQQYISSYHLQTKENAMKMLNEVTSNLITTRKAIKNSEEKLQKLTITANKPGVVNGLDIKLGSVITAGTPILEIIPLEKEFVVEAKIKSKDISHIKVGDPVNIKIMGYNFTQYGLLFGTVKEISASTFIDQDKYPYYQAIITLPQNYLGNSPAHKMLPGMTVEANIITGRRSLLSFLMRPSYRTVGHSS